MTARTLIIRTDDSTYAVVEIDLVNFCTRTPLDHAYVSVRDFVGVDALAINRALNTPHGARFSTLALVARALGLTMRQARAARAYSRSVAWS